MAVRGNYYRTESHSSRSQIPPPHSIEMDEEEKSHPIDSISESTRVLSRDPPTVVVQSKAQSFNSKHKHCPELQEVRIFNPGYSEWEGENRILCKGRIIGGPEIWKLIVTTTIISIPSILYLSCTFSLTHRIYNTLHSFKYFENSARILYITYDHIESLIGGAILSFLCISFLIITAEMDPGIIPRTSLFENPSKAYAASKSINGHHVNTNHFPFRQLINIDGHIVTHKYCITCKLI